MAFLTVFCESGIPHAGCLLEYLGDYEWLSFMPRASSFWDTFPGGNYGQIDTSDREHSIDNYVRFRILEQTLLKGRNDTVTDYYSATYGLFINDCVSFARDLSRACGLRTEGSAYDPCTFVNTLIRLNGIKTTHVNKNPYPWRLHRQDKPLKELR